MRFYILILILFFSVFSLPFVKGQNTSNIVNLSTPDKAKLEWLTYQSVNTLRQNKKLPDLVWDDVLYRAAIDHAEYEIHEKKLSHYQTLKGKKTPAERVKIHGGLVYTAIGENIVAITLGAQVISKGLTRSTVTYEAAAATMASLWKSSPGHYKNIISKNYNCTALAVSYDSVQQRLIAVQVFGYSSTPAVPAKLPDYSGYLLDLPTPKLPYGLKANKSKKQKAINGFLKFNIDRGYITGSYKNAKKVFRGRRSGITQEFIPLNQFDSASTEFSMVPNRRNALYELNGELSKPIYRRKLLKYSRRIAVPRYYINTKFIRLIKKPPLYFIYPLYPNGQEMEFNLFLIKNKSLEVYTSYIVIPGELLETPFPSLELTNQFKSQIIPDKYKIYTTYDTLNVKLYYASGQVIIDSLKQSEICDRFNAIKGKITSVQILAFASVEGDKASNDQLAKLRMDNFMTVVKPYLDTITIQPKLIKQEQWRLFYKQLDGTRLQFIKKMQPDAIRAYVNQHTSDTLLSYFLSQQRYLDVALTYRQEFKEKIKTKTPIEIFDSLRIECAKYVKPRQDLLAALERAQLAVYHEWSQTDSTASNHPLLQDTEKYPALKYHQLMFEYTVLGSISDKVFYDKLHVLGRSKYFPARLKNDLVYNNLTLIFRELNTRGHLNELMNYDDIDDAAYRKGEFFLKKQKPHVNKSIAFYQTEYYALKEFPTYISLGKKLQVNNQTENDLWKYYYVYTIHSLYEFMPLHPEINRMLPNIKKYFHPNDEVLTDTQRLKLAYFYTALQKYDIAQLLIEPIATRPEPNLEGLKLYLTLRYDDFEDKHEYTTYLIREFSRLGKTEWCDLWPNPHYLNFLLLEDLTLKEFYNCNCSR